MLRPISDKWLYRLAAFLLAVLLYGLGSALFSLAFGQSAGPLHLSWEHPTKYTNDADLPLADITKTIIEIGSCTSTGAFSVLDRTLDVAAPQNWVTISAEVGSTVCVRARTAVGDKVSDASNTASKTITTNVPRAPHELDETLPPGAVLRVDPANRVAYVLLQTSNALTLLPVGTVAEGTECAPDARVNDRYLVPWESVAFVGSTRSRTVFARCRAL